MIQGGTISLYALTYQILSDFQNCFTARIRSKFVITLSLKIPLHLKCKCLSQRFIDGAIGQWRRQLECVVQQQGGHIEHLT